jgi:hypothetical protein
VVNKEVVERRTRAVRRAVIRVSGLEGVCGGTRSAMGRLVDDVCIYACPVC